MRSIGRYQSDKVTGQSTYKPGSGLPLSVIKHLKPIYSELSNDDLLKKCLHGKTQNQNESLNLLFGSGYLKPPMSR